MPNFSTRVMRPEDWVHVRYFTAKEFVKPHLMGYEFIMWLDDVRHAAGVPMLISSSVRTPEHNEAVGGATDSAHLDVPCNAVDIRKNPKSKTWNYDTFRIVHTAMLAGCVRLGVYADDSIHLDRSEHKRPSPRLWRRV